MCRNYIQEMKSELTSKLMRFSERQGKNQDGTRAIINELHVFGFDIEYLIDTQEAKKCECVDSMHCTPCKGPTPVIGVLFELSTGPSPLVESNVMVFRQMIEIVQLLEDSLKIREQNT